MSDIGWGADEEESLGLSERQEAWSSLAVMSSQTAGQDGSTPPVPEAHTFSVMADSEGHILLLTFQIFFHKFFGAVIVIFTNVKLCGFSLT